MKTEVLGQGEPFHPPFVSASGVRISSTVDIMAEKAKFTSLTIIQLVGDGKPLVFESLRSRRSRSIMKF